jgi:hypothetical protein
LPRRSELARPPKYGNIDENGVELVTGNLDLALFEGSIGHDNIGLEFIEFWAGDAGRVENWSGGMYNRTAGGQTLTYVQLGSIADTFTKRV